MTSVVAFVGGEVGMDCISWLCTNYASDLELVVVIDESKIEELAKITDAPIELFTCSKQILSVIKRRGLSPDLGLLLWWPEIISEPLISVPRWGFINTHPSLLPYNKGKHYSFWAIVENAPFGVTLHVVDEGVDSGDIVAQRSIKSDWLDTGETLATKAKKEMVSLFQDTYPLLRFGSFCRIPQKKDEGSFHVSSDIKKATKIELNSMYRGGNLINLLRAKTHSDFDGCWFEDDGKKFEISLSIKEIK